MIRDILTFDARYRELRSKFIMGKITGVDFVIEEDPKKIPALLKKPTAEQKNKNAPK
jgi:hypothetical protein